MMKLKQWLWTLLILFLKHAELSAQISESYDKASGTSAPIDKTTGINTDQSGSLPEDGRRDNNYESSTTRTTPDESSTIKITDESSSTITRMMTDDVESSNTTRMTTDEDKSATDDVVTNMTNKGQAIGISLYVSYVITPLFVTTGLIGNALTVTVMLSKEFSSMTMSFILIALAMSDSTLLLTQPFTNLWVMRLIGMDVRAFSDLSCKIFFIFFRTSKMCSSWFVVLVCFERFIAVWFPLRARFICSKRNAVLSLASILATLLIFNGFWSFGSKVIGGKFCLVNYVYPAIVTKSKIFMIVGTLTYAGIPTILLAVMTPAIICRVVQQMKLRRSLSEATLCRKVTNHKTVAMLLSVMVAYILLATPIVICLNVARMMGENLFQTTVPTLSVIREIAQPLELLNYSINFFLYVACSKTFRGRVAEMLYCRAARNRDSRITIFTTDTKRESARK